MIINKMGETYQENRYTNYIIGGTVTINACDHPYHGLCGTVVEIRSGKDSAYNEQYRDYAEVILKVTPPVLPVDVEALLQYHENTFPLGSPWKLEDLTFENVPFRLIDVTPRGNVVYESIGIFKLKEVYACDLQYEEETICFYEVEQVKSEINARIMKAKAPGGYLHGWESKGYHLKEEITNHSYKVMVQGTPDAEEDLPVYEISFTSEQIQLASDVVREVGWIYQDAVHSADFFSRVDENEDVSDELFDLMVKEKDEIIDAIEDSLGHNDMYWDIYWGTMDDVADEFAKNHREELEQLALECEAMAVETV